jgi:hypothetical protein
VNPTVLETLQTYRAAKNPVNRRIPQNFHGISTLGILERDAGEPDLKPKNLVIPSSITARNPLWGTQTRNDMAFRLIFEAITPN